MIPSYTFFVASCLLVLFSVSAEDFYSFTVKDVQGQDVSLEQYRGKVSLVVNVASECGYTDKHYKQLVKLQNELLSTGKFNVLAFPCNQFGAQEPGSNEDILKFAKRQYSVNFPVFAKIDVVGENAHPAFTYLIDQSVKTPTWNFWKYLVDSDGKVLDAWGPQKSVDSVKETIRREVAVASNLILEPGADDKQRIHPEL